MIDFTRKSSYDFSDLVRLNHLLRSPGGCPWDQAQDHQSIRRNFLEETYECCEAIDLDNPALLQEELGDVLMQVVFHADLEADRGRFTIDDVCDGAVKKLVFRHPQLFGEPGGQSWEERKAQEKGQKTTYDVLNGVSRALPGLWRGEKLLKKSGLPVPTAQEAQEGVQEALEAEKSAPEQEKALGQLLFAAIRLCYAQGIDPEMALQGALEDFVASFQAEKEQ